MVWQQYRPRLTGYQIVVLIIVNGYEVIDRNILIKRKEGSTIRGHEVVLVIK